MCAVDMQKSADCRHGVADDSEQGGRSTPKLFQHLKMDKGWLACGWLADMQIVAESRKALQARLAAD